MNLRIETTLGRTTTMSHEEWSYWIDLLESETVLSLTLLRLAAQRGGSTHSPAISVEYDRLLQFLTDDVSETIQRQVQQTLLSEYSRDTIFE